MGVLSEIASPHLTHYIAHSLIRKYQSLHNLPAVAQSDFLTSR
jgi:hypothetical protein